MANREAVVIWLEGIEGGTGHFGVDLTLSSGINPCRPIGNPPQPSIWLPYCCGPSYRWCPRYGTTDSPQLPQAIVVTNFTPDGKQTNFASNLVRYDVEVYSYNADGQESIYPTHMAVRFDGTSFSPIDSKTPSTYYTTHWGQVRLKEIDYRKGRENYALYNGYITHQGQRVYDYTLGVILWGTGTPHDRAGHGGALYGYKFGGNKDRLGILKDPSYWTSGPVLPGDYNVKFNLIAPNGRKSTKFFKGLSIRRPFEFREIKVEDYFTSYELEVDPPSQIQSQTQFLHDDMLAELRFTQLMDNEQVQAILLSELDDKQATLDIIPNKSETT
jgi:hypothetical protein